MITTDTLRTIECSYRLNGVSEYITLVENVLRCLQR